MKKICKTVLSIVLSFACITSFGVKGVTAQTIEDAYVLYEDTDGSAAQSDEGITAAPATDPELGECRRVLSVDGYTCGGLTAHAFVQFDMSSLQVDMTKNYMMISMDYKTDSDLSKLGVVINGTRQLISDDAGAIAGKYKKNVWNSICVVYDMSSETAKYYGDSLVYINGIQSNGNGMLQSGKLARIKWDRMTSLEMVLADKTSDGQAETFIDNVRLCQTDDIDTVLRMINNSKFEETVEEDGDGDSSTAYNGVLQMFRDRDAGCVKKASEAWTVETKTEDGIGEYRCVNSSDYANIAAYRSYAALDVNITNKDFDSRYPYLLVGVNFKTGNRLERFVLTGNNNTILVSGHNTGFIGGGRYSRTEWNKAWFVYDINSENNYTNLYGDSMVYINGKQQYGTGFMESNRSAVGGIKNLSSIGILFANRESSDTSETVQIAVDDVRIYMADSIDTVTDVVTGSWDEPATEVTDVQIDGKIRSDKGTPVVCRDSVQLRIQYGEQIDAASFDKKQVMLNGQKAEDVTCSGKNVYISLKDLSSAKSYTLSLKNIGKDVCGAQLADKEVKFRTTGDIDVEKMAIYKEFAVPDTIVTGILTPRIIGVSNNTKEDKNVTAFSVLMKDGMIESIASKSMIIPANEKVDVSSFEVNVPETAVGQYVLKMFLWDSISSGIGYIKHIEIK